MRVAGRHWAMALSAAVLVHAGVATAVLWQPSDPGAKSAGSGGIAVSLGSTGGAGRVLSAALEAPQTETVVSAETIADLPVQEARTVKVAETVPLEKKVEVAKRPPPVEDTRTRRPTSTSNTQPQEEVVARLVVAPPRPRPKPRPSKQARKKTMSEPISESTKEPRRTARTAEPAVEQMTAIAALMPGAGGITGTQTSLDTGGANDIRGGGVPGETAVYMALLQAWLEKHKKYPNRARIRHQEGIAVLSFSLGSKGQLLKFKLKRSTGYRLLDTAVLQMVQRAEPFPSIPESLGHDRVDVTVPVYFALD